MIDYIHTICKNVLKKLFALVILSKNFEFCYSHTGLRNKETWLSSYMSVFELINVNVNLFTRTVYLITSTYVLDSCTYLNQL